MSHVIEKERVARCYAEALSDTLPILIAFELVAQEFRRLVPYLSSEELRQIWFTPRLSMHEKQSLLQDLLDAAGQIRQSASSPSGEIESFSMLRSFFCVVLQAGRMSYLEQIDGELQKILEKRRGQKLARLVVASPLSSEQNRKIRSVAEEVFSGKLQWQVEQNPSLIAGFQVLVGHRCYDGSLQSRLRALGQNLFS